MVASIRATPGYIPAMAYLLNHETRDITVASQRCHRHPMIPPRLAVPNPADNHSVLHYFVGLTNLEGWNSRVLVQTVDPVSYRLHPIIGFTYSITLILIYYIG